MPFFSVGIPTYNRAGYLPYTLSCLLQQTFHDFEIIISDNASTDNTPDVVKQFRDGRIRYLRQPATVSMEENWFACAEQAQADWLVFNQDDDVLCPFFLERCANAIKKAPHIIMYATECGISTDIARTRGGGTCGAPLRHRWDEPQPRLIPGVQIAALAWFVNCFFPPAQAMPTRLFLKHCPRGPEAIYLGDHCLTSRIACEGVIAYEGYNGALIRDHAKRATNTVPDIQRLAVETPFIALRRLFEVNKLDWQNALRTILAELPLAYREGLLDTYLFNQFIAPEAMEILATGIATEKGVSPVNYVADLRTEKLKPPPIGRLDRWNVPRPVVRVIRGFLYAAGKDY
jgi:glycosyltransferase involved in cell wall biosynthesis